MPRSSSTERAEPRPMPPEGRKADSRGRRKAFTVSEEITPGLKISLGKNHEALVVGTTTQEGEKRFVVSVKGESGPRILSEEGVRNLPRTVRPRESGRSRLDRAVTGVVRAVAENRQEEDSIASALKESAAAGIVLGHEGESVKELKALAAVEQRALQLIHEGEPADLVEQAKVREEVRGGTMSLEDAVAELRGKVLEDDRAQRLSILEEEMIEAANALRAAEDRIRGLKGKEHSALSREINDLETKVQYVMALYVDQFRTGDNKNISSEALLKMLEEKVGEGIIIGPEFAGIKTQEALTQKEEQLGEVIEALEADEETATSPVTEALRVKARAVTVVEGLWAEHPDVAQALVAKAEKTKTPAEIRATREYLMLVRNFSIVKGLEAKAEALQHIRYVLAHADERGMSKRVPELVDAMELFLEDNEERIAEAQRMKAELKTKREKRGVSELEASKMRKQEREAEKAKKKEEEEPIEALEAEEEEEEDMDEKEAAPEATDSALEDAFMAEGDSGMYKGRMDAIGKELGIGDGSNVRDFFQNFSAYRDVLAQSKDPAERALATMTLEQFVQLPDTEPLPKGFFASMGARLKRTFSPGPSPRQQMHEQLMAAMKRNERAVMSSEDLLRSSQRARDMYESQKARFREAAGRSTLGSMRFGDMGIERRGYRGSDPALKREPGEKLVDLETLPPGAESDALKSTRAYERQIAKTKDANVKAKLEKVRKSLEAKDRKYRDALPAFFDRMNFDEQKKQAEDDDVDFNHIDAVEGYRRVYANIMEQVKQSPGRDLLFKELQAAGVTSFDDIVIAAPNKRKFDKAWNAYLSVAQQMSAGKAPYAGTPVNRDML